MSPASAPRPAHQPVLWLTAGADQTEAALPAVGHLLDHGHRVTLACPAEAWAELVADGQPTQEADADAHPEPETFRELATRGLRVLHPTPVDSGDARSLLHSLHRDDEAPTFEDTLRRDPRLARAAEESLVVWPGSARPTHLDGVDVATGAGGGPARRAVIPPEPRRGLLESRTAWAKRIAGWALLLPLSFVVAGCGLRLKPSEPNL